MSRLIVVFKTDLYPYVRTTKRQMYVDPAYQKYHAAKQQIRAATADAMYFDEIAKLPKVPLRLALFVNVPGAMHRRDISNILKGVEDGAQHAAYDNDAWIDQVAAVRVQVENREQKAIMIVQPVEEGPASFSTWLAEMEQVAREEGVVV